MIREGKFRLASGDLVEVRSASDGRGMQWITVSVNGGTPRGITEPTPFQLALRMQMRAVVRLLCLVSVESSYVEGPLQ